MISEANEIIHEFAQYANAHEHEDYLSIYLNVDPGNPKNQNENPAWKIKLKNAITDIEATLDPVQLRAWKKVRLSDTSPETAWARTRKRLDKYLTSYSPAGKTLVLFISPSAEYRYELPIPLENAVHYGKPHIQEFLWALDEYEQHLVLLIAEDQARALVLALGDTSVDLQVRSDEAWLRNVRKSAHSQNIESRKDDLSRRFVNTVADRLDKFFMGQPDIQRIVLGGNEEMAHAVNAAIHPATRDKVIGILPIPIDSTHTVIADRIRVPANEAERDHELALVNQILNMAGSNGRGALGFTAVQRAAERSAVQAMALNYPSDSPAVEPLLLDAVQAGAFIEFVKGPASDLVEKSGGIVARLYYPMS